MGMSILIPDRFVFGEGISMLDAADVVVVSDKSAGWRILAVEWLGNIVLWASGTILTISPELAKSSAVVFFALFVGQFLWGLSAFLLKKWSLLASSVFFCFLNVYGVFVRF